MRHLRVRQFSHLHYRRPRRGVSWRWERIAELQTVLRRGNYDWWHVLWVVSDTLQRLAFRRIR
jgi:hypothetical protein